MTNMIRSRAYEMLTGRWLDDDISYSVEFRNIHGNDESATAVGWTGVQEELAAWVHLVPTRELFKPATDVRSDEVSMALLRAQLSDLRTEESLLLQAGLSRHSVAYQAVSEKLEKLEVWEHSCKSRQEHQTFMDAVQADLKAIIDGVHNGNLDVNKLVSHPSVAEPSNVGGDATLGDLAYQFLTAFELMFPGEPRPDDFIVTIEPAR